MRVRERLDLLPGIEHQHQGDLDAAFTGVTTGLPRRPPKGRFIVIRDDSWPAETKGEDPDVPNRRRAERRIRTAFSRGATGVICSSSLQSSSVVEGKNVFFSTDTYELVRGMYWTVLSSISQSGQYEHTVIEASSAAFLAYRQHDFSISPDVAIINRDTLRTDLLMERAVAEGCQLVTYGESPEATIRLIESDPETRRTVARVGQKLVEYAVGTEGKHNAINSLAVIAALRAHHMKNWRAGVESLAEFQAVDGRGKTVEVDLPNGPGITLTDEAYNANPTSIRSSVASLASRSVPEGSRRIAVPGDIGELGTQAEELHRGLAVDLADAELDQVFLFGEHMQHLYQVARGRAQNVRHWETLEDLRTDLPQLLRDGDVVLMKASGTMGLQGLVKDLIVTHE